MVDATIFSGERVFDALYPPTVEPAPRPLPLHKFLYLFVRNPLTSLPQAAYEEKIVRLDTREPASSGFPIRCLLSACCCAMRICLKNRLSKSGFLRALLARAF